MEVIQVSLVIVISSILGTNGQNIVPIPGGLSGEGTTTRYWDCCKPSCAWRENIQTPRMIPVRSCGIDGQSTIDRSTQSGCSAWGNAAFMCNDQQPFVVNSNLAYGFAAASFQGGADTNKCCRCMLLTFQGQLQGKQLLVQVTNTGGDLSRNHFDLAIPGGGVGIFNQGCMQQWKTSPDGWGDRYGGVHNINECYQLPWALQQGCRFRFEFLQGADNPRVYFQEVVCPRDLIDRSQCE